MPNNTTTKRIAIKTSNDPTRYGKTVQKRTSKKGKSPRSASNIPTSYPEVNERCKAIREELGYTQQELAEKMRLNVSMVKAVETTVSVPNLFYLVQLRRLSRKPLDYIIIGPDYKNKF